MTATAPFGLMRWIDDNRDLLKPPTGGKTLWQSDDLMITIVGGPNTRTDFHIDPFEEFFYQIKGDITLCIQEDGAPRDVTIREGEIFLLPRTVPARAEPPRPTRSA